MVTLMFIAPSLPLWKRLKSGLTVGCVALLSAGVLSGCSVFEAKKAPLPCPQIKIDRDTVQVTKFRPGGTDLTDVALEAEIIGYAGECSVNRDTNEVDMRILVNFRAKLGPAAPLAGPGEPRSAKFDYFVALPDFYPHPEGKKVFTAEIGFPPNVNQLRFRDAEIDMTLPLAKDMSSGDAQVYLGMQLSRDELEYNRKNRPKY
jgi:hypothetical protein